MALPTLRPLAPATLVAATAAGLGLACVTGRMRYLLPTVLWGAVVGVAGGRMGRQPGVRAVDATAALAICHVAHGMGFWSGIGRVVRGRSFDRLPAGSR